MNRVAVVIFFWAALSATSAVAQQVCTSGIPPSTPTADFTGHGDGTVTHIPTGLMWKQCLEGLSGTDCATGTPSTYTWQQALQLAEGYSFAGYSDWRLPNIKELGSIVESSCHAPGVNLSVFPNDPGSNVWSDSPIAASSDAAWLVGFYFGGNGSASRDYNAQVRLVRGGG